jgi:hypothetical protein
MKGPRSYPTANTTHGMIRTIAASATRTNSRRGVSWEGHSPFQSRSRCAALSHGSRYSVHLTCTPINPPISQTVAVRFAVYFAHYNFCRHQTLRVTPAMESEITDHVWTIAGIWQSAIFWRCICLAWRRMTQHETIGDGTPARSAR